MSGSQTNYKVTQEKLASVFRPNFPNDKTNYSSVMPTNSAMKRYTNANCGVKATPDCIAGTYTGRKCKRGNCNMVGQQGNNTFGQICPNGICRPCVGPIVQLPSINSYGCVTKYNGISGVAGCVINPGATAQFRAINKDNGYTGIYSLYNIEYYLYSIPGEGDSDNITNFIGSINTPYNTAGVNFTSICWN